MSVSLKRMCMAGIILMAAGGALAHDEAKPSAADAADGTAIVPLLSKPLPDVPGKEALMLTVEYAPGASTPRHRHDAHVFVYVLSGSIIMQADGAPAVTLTPGQTFYESPTDVHAVSRNASATQPAKFLVFMLKPAGSSPVLPAQ